MAGQTKDSTAAGVKMVAKPPLIYLVSIVSGTILHFLVPLTLFASAAATLIGLALIVASLSLMFWATAIFSQAKTSVNPDIAPTTLVKSGPFRFTRNPMYLGFTFLQIGISLAIGSAWLILTLIPTLIVMIYGVIKREELFMAEKFGQSYLEYKAAVRRWL